MCDTQSPYRALLSINGAGEANECKHTDHISKSPMDMQHGEKDRGKQDGVNGGMLTLQNTHKALVNNALG